MTLSTKCLGWTTPCSCGSQKWWFVMNPVEPPPQLHSETHVEINTSTEPVFLDSSNVRTVLTYCRPAVPRRGSDVGMVGRAEQAHSQDYPCCISNSRVLDPPMCPIPNDMNYTTLQ